MANGGAASQRRSTVARPEEHDAPSIISNSGAQRRRRANERQEGDHDAPALSPQSLPAAIAAREAAAPFVIEFPDNLLDIAVRAEPLAGAPSCVICQEAFSAIGECRVTFCGDPRHALHVSCCYIADGRPLRACCVCRRNIHGQEGQRVVPPLLPHQVSPVRAEERARAAGDGTEEDSVMDLLNFDEIEPFYAPSPPRQQATQQQQQPQRRPRALIAPAAPIVAAKIPPPPAAAKAKAKAKAKGRPRAAQQVRSQPADQVVARLLRAYQSIQHLNRNSEEAYRAKARYLVVLLEVSDTPAAIAWQSDVLGMSPVLWGITAEVLAKTTPGEPSRLRASHIRAALRLAYWHIQHCPLEPFNPDRQHVNEEDLLAIRYNQDVRILRTLDDASAMERQALFQSAESNVSQPVKPPAPAAAPLVAPALAEQQGIALPSLAAPPAAAAAAPPPAFTYPTAALPMYSYWQPPPYHPQPLYINVLPPMAADRRTQYQRRR